MVKWIVGFCALFFLGMAVWQIFRKKDLRSGYVLGPVVAALAIMLALVFPGIGRKNADIFGSIFNDDCGEENQSMEEATSVGGSLSAEYSSESGREQESGSNSQGQGYASGGAGQESGTGSPGEGYVPGGAGQESGSGSPGEGYAPGSLGQENILSSLVQEQNYGSSPAGGGLASEQAPQAARGTAEGCLDYTGYLDECIQWLDCGSFAGRDYDGDGIVDRVWRENVQSSGVADYRIEFGNGDRIELPMTGEGIPMVRTLDLEGDGVREILFTESFDYTTDFRAYGQMALFRKTAGGYTMLELPGGMTRVGSEERDADGRMLRYRATLSFLCEEADDPWTMRVTCPALESVEGLEALDVKVDFTQEQWESGNYDETYLRGGEPLSVIPYQVDVVSLGNGCDALELRFGMPDPWWCADEAVVTLQWKKGSLCIENVRYWHEYIETVYTDIDTYSYELILRGAGYVGENRYTIDSIQVVRFSFDEQFAGLVEDQIQMIDLNRTAEQYWGDTYSFGADPPGAAVSDSRDGDIRLLDLNFDGKEDFCIQGWIPEDDNIPYYCYIWNTDRGEYEYGGCLPNVRVRSGAKKILCPIYENDKLAGNQYYRYEDGIMVMERYVQRNALSGGVVGGLDLTYVETGYSMDTADYVRNVSKIFQLAEQALTELYQMTGTKMESACFAVTEFGDFAFALTEADLRKGAALYSRCFGEEDIFKECISHAVIADGVAGLAPKGSSAVSIATPPDAYRMTDEEIVQWFFEKSPFAQGRQWQFGNTTVTAGDKVDTMEETFEGNYVIRTKSGKYYELTYNKDSRTVSAYFGPYESYPMH